MMGHDRTLSVSNGYTYDVNQVGEITMSEYEDTFIIVINMRRNDFRLIDNPYVEVHSNKARSGWVVESNEEIGLRECREDELDAKIP